MRPHAETPKAIDASDGSARRGASCVKGIESATPRARTAAAESHMPAVTHTALGPWAAYILIAVVRQLMSRFLTCPTTNRSIAAAMATHDTVVARSRTRVGTVACKKGSPTPRVSAGTTATT